MCRQNPTKKKIRAQVRMRVQALTRNKRLHNPDAEARTAIGVAIVVEMKMRLQAQAQVQIQAQNPAQIQARAQKRKRKRKKRLHAPGAEEAPMVIEEEITAPNGVVATAPSRAGGATTVAELRRKQALVMVAKPRSRPTAVLAVAVDKTLSHLRLQVPIRRR